MMTTMREETGKTMMTREKTGKTTRREEIG